MVPGQGMLVFGLGLVTGGDRLLAMPLAKTGKRVFVIKYRCPIRPSRPSLRICTQGSSNFVRSKRKVVLGVV